MIRRWLCVLGLVAGTAALSGCDDVFEDFFEDVEDFVDDLDLDDSHWHVVVDDCYWYCW